VPIRRRTRRNSNSKFGGHLGEQVVRRAIRSPPPARSLRTAAGRWNMLRKAGCYELNFFTRDMAQPPEVRDVKLRRVVGGKAGVSLDPVGSVCSRRWCATSNLSVRVRVSCAKLVLTFVELVVASSIGGIDDATLPAYDPPRPATQRVTTQTVLINFKPPCPERHQSFWQTLPRTGIINLNFVLHTMREGLSKSLEPNCS
jgi:hypothetical protein